MAEVWAVRDQGGGGRRSFHLPTCPQDPPCEPLSCWQAGGPHPSLCTPAAPPTSVHIWTVESWQGKALLPAPGPVFIHGLMPPKLLGSRVGAFSRALGGGEEKEVWQRPS